MRPSDSEILRELLRGSTMWSGTIDPAETAPEIARRLGTVRSTVWARLRRWQRSGFLQRLDVAPNPGLFGYLMGAGRVSVEGASRIERFLEELELHQGVIGCIDTMGGELQINVVAPDIGGITRWERLFASLPGVRRAFGFEPIRIPPCEIPLKELDWRLMQQLLLDPATGLAGAARVLHLTPKSAARRHRRLLESHAMWYVPVLDFTRQHGETYGLFNIIPDPNTAPGVLVPAVQQLVPSSVELSDETRFSLDPEFPLRVVYVLATFGSAAAAEKAQRAISGIEGVARVELLFPLSYRWYPKWSLDQLTSRARRSEAAPLRSRPEVQMSTRRRPTANSQATHAYKSTPRRRG